MALATVEFAEDFNCTWIPKKAPSEQAAPNWHSQPLYVCGRHRASVAILKDI